MKGKVMLRLCMYLGGQQLKKVQDISHIKEITMGTALLPPPPHLQNFTNSVNVRETARA